MVSIGLVWKVAHDSNEQVTTWENVAGVHGYMFFYSEVPANAACVGIPSVHMAIDRNLPSVDANMPICNNSRLPICDYANMRLCDEYAKMRLCD